LTLFIKKARFYKKLPEMSWFLCCGCGSQGTTRREEKYMEVKLDDLLLPQHPLTEPVKNSTIVPLENNDAFDEWDK
jgi:hypothetical protein